MPRPIRVKGTLLSGRTLRRAVTAVLSASTQGAALTLVTFPSSVIPRRTHLFSELAKTSETAQSFVQYIQATKARREGQP